MSSRELVRLADDRAAMNRRLTALLDELAVEPILHAGGTKSSMGGSSVSDEVAEIMRAALEVFVPMEELLAAVGDGIARLLDVESAAVVAGGASGCVLAAAAVREHRRDCREEGQAGRSTPDVLVTQRRHYGRYTYLYEQAACHVREIGTMNDCLTSDYQEAFDHRTVGVAWLEGPGIRTAGVQLSDVCELAAEHGLPVIVDAAAMAFPMENLHDYLRAGADLVVVSGGKLVHGPQASGFVLGRRDLVELIRQLGFPHQGVARAHKVPKEVALGAYAAVRKFVTSDAAAVSARARERAEHVAAELTLRRVAATVAHDSLHALPAVVLPNVKAATNCLPSVLSARMLSSSPRIFLPYNDARDELYVEFASLAPHDDLRVVERLAEVILEAKQSPRLTDAPSQVLASSR